MEDAAIVALYWARDEQALAETAAKFGAYCRKIADNILHSAHDAEECENDTWLAAWNSMPTNRPARLAPYLGRITRNLALDRFDRAAAQKRGSGQTCAPLDELAECVAAPGSVEDSFDAAETGRLISAFLRTLPEETRSIFLRRYWYCDATADIAARYGLTESKVRVTLHRTRGRLAAYLKGCCTVTERELFEAIGHVDDDLILAADAPVKKRRRVVHLHWQQVVSVAACACIVLGGAAVWRSGALHKSSIAGEVAMAADVPEAAAETAPAPDMPMLDAAAPQAADADEGAAVEKDSAASGIALGLAQCVQIDGVLYFDTGSAVDCPPDRGADGVIETSVDRDAFPETDGCSNFGTGYSYWVTGDNAVVVEIDGAYWEFMAN